MATTKQQHQPRKVYVVRHASAAPVTKQTPSDMDRPLTAAGLELAKATGMKYSIPDILRRQATILSSPALRCRQTMEGLLQKPVGVDRFNPFFLPELYSGANAIYGGPLVRLYEETAWDASHADWAKSRHAWALTRLAEDFIGLFELQLRLGSWNRSTLLLTHMPLVAMIDHMWSGKRKEGLFENDVVPECAGICARYNPGNDDLCRPDTVEKLLPPV